MATSRPPPKALKHAAKAPRFLSILSGPSCLRYTGTAPHAWRNRAARGWRESAADQQRVDEIVGMVDAKEHGPDGGHTLGVPHVHRAEKEPEPEAPDGAHGAVEAVHRVAPHPGVESRAHGISRRANRFTSSSKSLTASASAHAAPSESRP